MAGTFRNRPFKAVIWQAQNQFVEAWFSLRRADCNMIFFAEFFREFEKKMELVDFIGHY